MRQKGFAPVLILLIVVVIGAGIIYFKGRSKSQPFKEQPILLQQSPTPIPQPTAPITPKPVQIETKFVSPVNGQEVVEGQSYWVELKFANPDDVAKVEIGMGKLENPFNLYSLSQPPFKYLQKIPDPSNISAYLAGPNTSYLVALISYKSGAKETKYVKISVVPPKVSIWFTQPEIGKTFKVDETIKVQAGFNTPGDPIEKVDFYYTSQIIKSFTSEPYLFDLDLGQYCKGLTEQHVPLSVTAKLKSGRTISDSRDVYCKI